jgi:hypothetical protein
MRTPLFALLASIAIAAGAQDRAKPQEPDKDEQARIRAERSAGGIGKITPEEEDRGGTSDKGLESGDGQRDDRRP